MAGVNLREGIQYIGFIERFLAFVLDTGTFIVIAIPYFVPSGIWGWGESDGPAWVWIVFAFLFVIPVITVLVIQIYLLGTRGQTIGKKVFGLRIINSATFDVDGYSRNLLLREAARLLLWSVAPLGKPADILFLLGREDHRSLHDLIANTAVVRFLPER